MSVPPQTVAEALATVKPGGSVSVKATPVRDTVFAAGLVMVNVSEVVPLTAMPAGLKALAIDGGATAIRNTKRLIDVATQVDVPHLLSEQNAERSSRCLAA